MNNWKEFHVCRINMLFLTSNIERNADDLKFVYASIMCQFKLLIFKKPHRIK